MRAHVVHLLDAIRKSHAEEQDISHSKSAAEVFFPIRNRHSKVVCEARDHLVLLSAAWHTSSQVTVDKLSALQAELNARRKRREDMSKRISEHEQTMTHLSALEASLQTYSSALANRMQNSGIAIDNIPLPSEGGGVRGGVFASVDDDAALYEQFDEALYPTSPLLLSKLAINNSSSNEEKEQSAEYIATMQAKIEMAEEQRQLEMERKIFAEAAQKLRDESTVPFPTSPPLSINIEHLSLASLLQANVSSSPSPTPSPPPPPPPLSPPPFSSVIPVAPTNSVAVAKKKTKASSRNGLSHLDVAEPFEL